MPVAWALRSEVNASTKCCAIPSARLSFAATTTTTSNLGAGCRQVPLLVRRFHRFVIDNRLCYRAIGFRASLRRVRGVPLSAPLLIPFAPC
jgi:hypothetical protein